MSYTEHKPHKLDNANDLLKDKSLSMDDLISMSFCNDDNLLKLGQIYRAAQKMMIDNGYQSEDVSGVATIALNLAWLYCEQNNI